MRKKKLTKVQSKELWLKAVDELLEPMWGEVDMTSTIEKLKKVKFTYGGEMVSTTKSGRECPYYRLARWSFPSLYNYWYNMKTLEENAQHIVDMNNESRSKI